MTTTSQISTIDNRTPLVLRALRMLAPLSGGALIVDTVTIAVINRNFDPLDSILFLAGFVGLWLTAIALAAYVTANRRGASRLFRGAGVFLLTVAVLGAISAIFDQFGRHVFAKSNIGLHGEWSFFSIGICLLVIGAWAFRQRAVPARGRPAGSTADAPIDG